MEDEAAWLKQRVDHYWRLLSGVMDERAVQSILQLIAELEARLKQIAEIEPAPQAEQPREVRAGE